MHETSVLHSHVEQVIEIIGSKPHTSTWYHTAQSSVKTDNHIQVLLHFFLWHLVHQTWQLLSQSVRLAISSRLHWVPATTKIVHTHKRYTCIYYREVMYMYCMCIVNNGTLFLSLFKKAPTKWSVAQFTLLTHINTFVMMLHMIPGAYERRSREGACNYRLPLGAIQI